MGVAATAGWDLWGPLPFINRCSAAWRAWSLPHSREPRRRARPKRKPAALRSRLQFGGVARAVPLTISYRRATVQLLVVLALVPLCVAFGYTVAAMLDDGSVVH